MKRKFGFGLCVSTLALMSCTDVSGPPRTIGARGPVGKSAVWKPGTTLDAAGLQRAKAADRMAARQPDGMVLRFYIAEKAAFEADQSAASDGDFAVVPAPVTAAITRANEAARERYRVASEITRADHDLAVDTAKAKVAGAKANSKTDAERKVAGEDIKMPSPLVQRAFTPLPLPTFAQYNAQVQDRMLDTGFTLTYSYCSDFFLSQGKRQTALLTMRDAIATAGTLAVGALALVNFQSTATQSTVLAVVGLSASAATAGTDIYTQRFLFGAENIDAVRDLTLQAVAAHQIEIHSKHASFLYDDVVKALLDNQAICTPRHIALLARQAIAHGTIEASAPSTAQKDLQGRADALVAARLASNLGLETPLSDDQLVAIWWLAKESPVGDEAQSERALIPALAATEPTLTTVELIGTLSAARQATLHALVASAREKAKQASPAEKGKTKDKTTAPPPAAATVPPSPADLVPALEPSARQQPHYDLPVTTKAVSAQPM